MHHLAVLSDAADGYAPPGNSLISVTHVGGQPVEPEDTLRELSGWLDTTGWRFLRRYVLEEALPTELARHEQADSGDERVLLCGDHASGPSLNFALASGRQVGERIEA